MISSSPISHKQVRSSLGKLKKVSSDHRFRIKSLRFTTNETNAQEITNLRNSMVDKDYEKQLNQAGWDSQFLYQLYTLKSEESKLQTSQSKYKTFVKSFYCKLIHTKNLSVGGFNLQHEGSLRFFLRYFIEWNHKFISVDLGYCGKTPLEEIINMIKRDKKVVKLRLNNMALDYDAISEIMVCVNQEARLYELDLSNLNSQGMNRFGENYQILYDFALKNSVTGVLKLDNLNLKKQGIEFLARGIEENRINISSVHNLFKNSSPLRILNLKNNGINQHGASVISTLVRFGLQQLDLSENPLSPEFFNAMPSWKANTVKTLDVSSTQMDSKSLITFLQKIQDNKAILSLKADRNDFSHHWFSHTKVMMQINSSLETISLNDCNIKYLSSLFEGLTYNRYMKKVSVSNNLFDNENFKKVCEAVVINKSLQEIKMRFCNLKEKEFASFFNAVSKSKSIKIVDVSENNLGEEGSRALLKALNTSKSLENVVLEKVQVSMRIKKEIDQKIKENRHIRQNQAFKNLKRENKAIRKKDQFTWEDLEDFQAQVKNNEKQIKMSDNKVQSINHFLDNKKEMMTTWVQNRRQQDRALQTKLRIGAKRKAMQVQQIEGKMKTIDQYCEKVNSEMEIQTKLIFNLEQRIRKQNEKIHKRQNELEDYYKDRKYLNNKKKEEEKKVPFDNIASVVRSKKSGQQK